MVGRNLNTPVGKIGSFPLFWMKEHGANWHCRCCGEQKLAGSISFEMTVRHATRKFEGKSEGVKLFLCLDCATKQLEEALEKVKLCKNVGAEAYRLFKEA